MTEKSFILLTTSRGPSKNTRAFCKDLSYVIPNVVRINRGKLSLDGVAEKALESNAEKVMITSRWKKGLGKIGFFEVDEEGLNAVPPLIYVNKVKLRKDFRENISKRRRGKSVVITTSQRHFSAVKRLGDALSEFFDISILPLKEVYDGNFDIAIQISAYSPNHIIIMFKLVPELVEVGPQMEISHLVWELSR